MYFGQGVREPKIEVTHVEKNIINFTLRNTDASMANNLRRCMIAEVPTMAIETVTMHDNSSVLFDEFICHRMGLLPLFSEDIGDTPEESGRAHPGTYNNLADCDCLGPTGCEYCCVEFELDVYNDNPFPIDVTHFDVMLKAKRHDRNHQIIPVPVRNESMSYEEDVRRNGIKLLKLGRNQHIKCSMRAVKNTSKSHAKFNPVGTAFFRYQPDIRFNSTTLSKLSLKEKTEIAESCPVKVYDIEEDALNGTSSIKVARPELCTFCDECVFKAKEQGYRFLLSVKPVPDVFNFTVESVGSRNAPDIVQAALSSYLYKLRLSSNRTEEVHDVQNRKAIAYEKIDEKEEKNKRKEIKEIED